MVYVVSELCLGVFRGLKCIAYSIGTIIVVGILADAVHQLF